MFKKKWRVCKLWNFHGNGRKWNVFVVFGIEYWAGNPNFSCCSLITSSCSGFGVLLHPGGSLSYPRSHEHDTAQLGSTFGASAEICQIQQGIWELQAFHLGDFYEDHPMSLCRAAATAPLAGPLHLWLFLSDPVPLDSLSLTLKNTCTLPKGIQIPLISMICFLRVWWSYHFFPNAFRHCFFLAFLRCEKLFLVSQPDFSLT